MLSSIAMTSCSKTVNAYKSQNLYDVDNNITQKNRIYQVDTMFNLTNMWTTGHLYIQHAGDGAHEMIVVCNGSAYSVYDSFLMHREKNWRQYPKDRFHKLIKTLVDADSTDLNAKTRAFMELCDPPANYLDGWDGKIQKMWLSPLN
jgi:hypothetical protein